MEFLLLKPLKNSLEGRATTLRAVRYLQLNITHEQFAKLCQIVFNRYRANPSGEITRVNQRIRGGYPKKVICYPDSFIPEMLDVIRTFHNQLYPKPKRPRIVR